MIVQDDHRIIAQQKVAPGYFRMTIYAPGIARSAQPGQFVHLRCNDAIEPLLRRPFSFHRLNGNNFQILYKTVGRGSKLLSEKRKGESIDVLGPLGHGFKFQQTNQQTIIIAGGMGVAPLLALAEKLKNKKNILVLLGAKTKKEILCADKFKQLGTKVQIATDDGSLGYKGLVTALLKKILRSTNKRTNQLTNKPIIYACGPKAMLKELARISGQRKLTVYASLEENMACGLGACLGCAIKTKKGYQRVCQDGPVFNLREIKW